MASNTSNKYVIPNLPDVDPRTMRVFRDLAERVNYLTDEIETVRKMANDVQGLALAASPKQGIINLPSPTGDGFIEVNKDGVINSYGSPKKASYALPITLSHFEGSTTSGSETIYKTSTISANLLDRQSHLKIQIGGFCIAQGGGLTITSVDFRGRFGTTGLTSPAFFQFTFAGGGASVAFYYGEFVLTHDIGSPGNPDYTGVGGYMLWAPFGGTNSFQLTRGELTTDFTVDNTVDITAAITGTGATNTVISETFEVIKYTAYES